MIGTRCSATGQAAKLLLDHIVGAGGQTGRHLDAECLSGLEVNDELELGRLHDRQV
jgi:hypothetical protein